jgi:acetyltransferase
LDEARAAGQEWLAQEQALGVLSAYGLNVAASRSAADAEAAVAAAGQIGYPVVVKAEAPGLVHKSDVGAVRLDLRDAGAVRSAFTDLAARVKDAGFAMDGALVMKQAPRGSEVLLGLTQDPKFGPLVAFGLGGIYAEVLKDVVFHLTPLTDEDARRMVRAIRAFPLLDGARGQPRADTEALADALTRLAKLGFDFPQIMDLDANPVFVHPEGEGVTVADARLRIDLAPAARGPAGVQTSAAPPRPSA